MFEHRTNEIVGEVSRLLRAMLDSIGCESFTPTGIQNSTSLNMKLSWKLSRVINAESLMAEAGHVPGPENQKTLVACAEKHGVSKDLRDKLVDAFRRFEQHIESEAGNRQTFEAMTSAIGGGDVAGILRKHRRDAFRANRQIFGIEADLQLSTVVVGISKKDPDRLDAAMLHCALGVRRTRPFQTPLVMMASGVTSEDSEAPIDLPEAELIGDSYVLKDFSSPDLPDIQEPGDSGFWQMPMHGEQVGLKESVDITMGRIFRSYRPRFAVPGLTYVGPRVCVQWAVPLTVMDCIIDRRLISGRGCIAREYAVRLAPYHGPIEMDEHLLDGNLPTASLGMGLSGSNLPEFPKYGSLLELAFDHLDADPRQFSVYRMRLEYPVMMSCIYHCYYLPTAE